MKKTIEQIKKEAPSFGSIPFWSWNDKLEPEELKKQMRNMKSLGMSGAFMHARAGLMTEYLSDEWFDCINACIDEAEKLGMQAWAYDENGWPSGFAGGLLLDDRYNLGIAVEEKIGPFPKADDEMVKDDLVIAVYEKNADGTLTRVTEDGGKDDYCIFWRHYSARYVDTLNAEVTKKFIASTHEEYKRRIPADKFGVGKPMPGFFTDEPQYTRWGNPYSNILPEEFEKAYGYSMYDALPALYHVYPGSDKHRFDYHLLLHKLFTNNFIKPVYDWCVANNCELTGHAVEESNLTTQMWCCGGCMPFYEYETIPGVDYLGRSVANDVPTKQLDSACAQLGKKKRLSEMFACVGWDCSPIELKKIAEMQYTNGVNVMCQHLYPYSERGQRKRDYPLHHSAHNPWQSALADFDRHFDNLGAALASGDEYAPVLVIHPMHSAYCKYMMNWSNYANWVNSTIGELEQHFSDFVDDFASNQIPYHFGDEWLMEKYGRVDGRQIVVGKCRYDAVVLPYLYSLDSSTVALLREFIANGGKVWLADGRPIYIDGADCGDRLDFLRSTATRDEILAFRDAVITENGACVPAIRKSSHLTPDGRILYLANVSEGNETHYPVKVSLARGNWAELDIDSLTLKPIFLKEAGDRLETTLLFREGECHALVEVSDDEFAALPTVAEPKPYDSFIPVPDTLSLVGKPTNMITLDFASRSNDGVHYDEPMLLMGIKDNLLREQYNGKVWLKFVYDVAEGYAPQSLRVAVEPMYEHVYVNGTEVFPDTKESWFDPHIGTADVASLTHSGRNEVVVEVNHYQRDYVYYVLFSGIAESLRNCLLFDTEIENIYLIGDFGVRTDGVFSDGERHATLYDGAFVLDKQPTAISSRDVVRTGFAFYGGELTGEFTYRYEKGGTTVLRADGRSATVAVSVNGKAAGKLVFEREIDLASFLTEGDNVISVTLCNAMRNTMGPHHRHDPEPYHVGPATFSYEKEWTGRECKDFLPRYAFIKFGLTK